jgi:O-antigen/teichoic acid export membrane protein
MLKDIAGTLFTRYLIAVLNLALIFVNARALGIEGLGLIGLIWASVSINVMINSVFSGSAIVYFLSKYPIRWLYPLAVGWTFAGSMAGCAVMQVLGLLPEGYYWAVYGLTLLYSLGVAHSRFLLGKDHIWGFNLTNILQGGLLFFVLMFYYYVLDRQEVGAYIEGLYLTNGLAVLVSLGYLLPFLRKPEHFVREKRLLSILKEIFVYGLWGSADNLAEACTARLNYFLVGRFAGLGSVGLLDAGTKISESVWNISRSVANIEYNRIAKMSERDEQKRITLQLFKLTTLAVALVMALILMIPEWIYTDYLFGPDFQGIRTLIAILSVGIVALGSHTILSHYFIGSGQIRYSAAASLVGLVGLLIAGTFLIPDYGVRGSALSSSIAFSLMLLFSLSVFVRQTKSRWRDFLPCRSDFRLSA